MMICAFEFGIAECETEQNGDRLRNKEKERWSRKLGQVSIAAPNTETDIEVRKAEHN